ncbi:MAG: hypothetical protein Q8832_02525, partial [Candidatus Phytoplasma australasiaticum]|nr:hypothetical protein [Candidatus Phytoplasma australasiaticum]
GMVSQGSDCDSDGVPDFMQDLSEEDGLGLINARREVEDFSVLMPSGEPLKKRIRKLWALTLMKKVF